jgi:hypothetical protein
MKIPLSSFFGISRIMPQTYRISSVRRLAPVVSLLILAILGLAPDRTHASLPYSRVFGMNLHFDLQQLTSIAAAPGDGFWVQRDEWQPELHNGQTLAKDGALPFGNVSTRGSIAAIPGRNGYWVVSDKGQLLARGNAPVLCMAELSSCSGYPASPFRQEYVVGAAATPTGEGLWALDRKGRVWTVGDAQSYGDVQSDSAIPTGIVATPSGKGYYIVLEDGGVFSFGDAVFFGSTGGNPPAGRKITGMALYIGGVHGTVMGYWLVGEDGGIHTFGNAPFWGSSGGDNGGNSVTGMVSFPGLDVNGRPQRTRGYAWVNSNGQVSVVNGPFLPPLPPQPGPGTPPPPDA